MGQYTAQIGDIGRFEIQPFSWAPQYASATRQRKDALELWEDLHVVYPCRPFDGQLKRRSRRGCHQRRRLGSMRRSLAADNCGITAPHSPIILPKENDEYLYLPDR